MLCTIEGSRPILVEVQALVSASTFGYAKRTASGLDQNRLSLLLAVLDKRVGLSLASEDVFVNVDGGLAVDEPASDLGVLAAIASSVRNRAIRSTTAMFGEVGLAGEVRGIPQAALRVREAVPPLREPAECFGVGHPLDAAPRVGGGGPHATGASRLQGRVESVADISRDGASAASAAA